MIFSGERISPTAAIASILNTYPFSVGIFRELLQNSDDAKASKQIFVLDYRHHPAGSLYHPHLADAQGPALLAYNDGMFSDQDWEAVQTIYESSKTADTSKIGKYGIGFRSSYHVTDNPQILSGSTLAMFDPHRGFTASGGATIDFANTSNLYHDQLAAFDLDFYRPDSAQIEPLSGTIIRLPLRTSAGPAGPARISLIKNAVVEPGEVRQLLQDFIDSELAIVLLFLTHISSIEIHEVDYQGKRRLAHAVLCKEAGGSTMTYRCTVTVTTENSSPVRFWRIVHHSFPESLSESLLSGRINQDASEILRKQKLSPQVALAMPLSFPEGHTNEGRLFTYLPLPLQTGFPCHIHGLFALTPDRQHLRNSEETGLVLGSTDAILVEWNRLLFEYFIPVLWAAFLPILLETDQHIDVFKLWPPYQPSVQGGDTIYWRSLPRQLLRAIVRKKSPIWPIVGQEERSEELGSVLVASGSEQSDLLLALAKAGLSITNPPDYVRDLLDDDVDHTPLNPASSRLVMLDNISSLLELDPSDRDCILTYLLSDMDLSNIIGLPIIPLVGGQHVSLSSSNNVETHTLLRSTDYAVFCDCDDSAIALHQLPPTVADLIFEEGPATLNVALLSCERVIDYLASSLDLESTVASAQTIAWLVKLWAWIGDWQDREPLYALINDFCLLPTSENTLVPPRHGIFAQLEDDDDVLYYVLQVLGIAFLHPDFNDDASRALYEQGVVQSSLDIHDILDKSTDVPSCFDGDIATFLRNHIISHLPVSCHKNGRLNEAQRLKLLALPIYPLLVPPTVSTGDNYATSELGVIPGDKNIICVTSMALLPVIDNTVFVHGCRSLLQHARSVGKLIKVDGVLSLAIHHLIKQPKHLQRAFIEYIVQHQDDITRGLLDKLSRTPFVPVANGILLKAAPVDVVDPDTDLAELLPPDDIRRPCVYLADDIAIINGLRRLEFLKVRLYDELVQERILFISRTHDNHILAQRLLRMMIESKYDCSGLEIDPELSWLPTREGKRGAQHCHHRDAHRPELFDKVLPALDVPKLTSSLQTALHWNEALPRDVVTRQFKEVLKERCSDRIVPIIKELGRRMNKLTAQDVLDLRDMSYGQEWVPNSSARLATAPHAVFSSPPLPDGFYTIPKNLTSVARLFLESMGCTERPSLNALMNDLNALSQRKCSLETTKKALVLLECLVPTNHCDILVPDINNHLNRRDKTYFNDLGHRASLIPLPDGCFLAHPKLDRELALRLELPFLGLSALKPFDDDDEDMGELLTTRISGVLLQYTVEQTFTELVSNAADAGAKHFDVLLDEQTFESSDSLSPTLAPFQSLPALVIHNDAIFEESDFKGIRRIGTGGKDGRSDSIGQFGLGALSLYHFTEVVMILSGDKVMFLDPSKAHLGFSGKASLLVPLSHIKRFHTVHLAPFDGLFGFSLNADFYHGTLFRLPLRSVLQAGKSLLSNKSLTAHDALRLLIGHYWDTAKDALLFTELETLSASHRNAAGSQSSCWSVGGIRSPSILDDHHFSKHTLLVVGNDPKHAPIKIDWQLVFHRTTHNDLPKEFQPLIKKHRLRDPVITGFAANLTQSRTKHQCKLFSGLPLPILTSLPVQFNASFILAEDRRSVRFDGDGQVNPESKYNHWLLTDLGPSLYIFLLEILLPRHDRWNKWWQWWPGAHQAGRDPMTNALQKSFYSQHLLVTSRRVCLNMAGIPLLPMEARLLVDDNSITKLLGHLKPREVIKLPDQILHLLGGRIQSVEPSFVRRVIMNNVEVIVRGYREWLSLDDLIGVTRFLIKDLDGVSSLIGLPLLPLASKNVTTWEERTWTTKMHYVWKHSGSAEYSSLFPLDRLVDSHFPAQEFLQAKNVNVSNMTGDAVRELVQNVIPSAPQRYSVTPYEELWITLLWSALTTMPGVSPQDLEDFPLVATSQSTTHISLAHSLKPHVFLTKPDEPKWLAITLTKLGAIIVSSACPAPVRAFFVGKKKVTGIGASATLPFLISLGASTLRSFSQSHGEAYVPLADWARTYIYDTPKGSVNSARNCLPIWPNLSNTSYLTGAEARVLPLGVTADIVSPFIPTSSNIVSHSTNLVSYLQVTPMNFGALRDVLNLPTTLPRASAGEYLRLLTLILSNRHQDRRDVRVPNTLGDMVLSSALYSISQDLFSQAFSTRPQNLIRGDFAHLEQQLHHFGLQTEMCLSSFTACVTAIHEDIHGENRVQRASALFNWYNNELPIHNAGQSWRGLHCLRFIPRNEVRQKTLGQQAALYTQLLPELVAPAEILRPDLEGIAWTQRALFRQPPSARLLIADLHLGVPSVLQVVIHLRILASRVAVDFPSNPHVLSDITKTYQWLESHKDDPQLVCIGQYKKEHLFLNVDDPTKTAWRWHCADKMFFDIPDCDNHFAKVGKYLSSFEGLLRCAGVKEIRNPDRPKLHTSSPEAQLMLIRSSFNDMRCQKVLTDVIFESDDGKKFPAHRVFLATQTDYFRDQFGPNWPKTGSATGEHLVTMTNYNGSTLEVTLDYIYTGVFPTAITEDQDELLQILHLSHYWSLPDLHETVQNLLTQHVSLDSFDDLRETAKTIGAKTLKAFCDSFETQNATVILELQK